MPVLEPLSQQSRMKGLFSTRLTVNRGKEDQLPSSRRQLQTSNQRLDAATSCWLIWRQKCCDLIAGFGNVGNQIAIQ